MSDKYKLPKEWFKQADYDLDTARAMFDSGRYIYTIFMCHLSIEKALKGVYAGKFEKIRIKPTALLTFANLSILIFLKNTRISWIN